MQIISCKVDTLAPKCCKHAAKERLKVQSVANTIQLQEWFPKCCKHQYEICDLSSKMLGANKNKHIRRKNVTVFIFSYHEGLIRPQHAVLLTCYRKAFWLVARWFWPSWKFWRVVWPAVCFAMVSGSHLVHTTELPCAWHAWSILVLTIFVGLVNNRCSQHLEVAGGINWQDSNCSIAIRCTPLQLPWICHSLPVE